MDFDKAGNAEDLDNKKLQLICNAYNRRLLSSQRVVDGINSMDYSKLKILCKYNNKFSYKGIEELLSDESIINNIKDYDDEMFRSMLNDAPSEHNILEILKGGEVCNTNNEFESSDSEEDKDLSDSFDCEESDEEMAMSSKSQSDSEEDKVKEDILKLQEDPEIAKNLSFIDDQTLKVICKKFSSSDIKALLENQAVVVNITDYNNKELEHVFNICSSFTIQDTIKVLSITPKKLKLICDKVGFIDARTLLENQAVVKHINCIGYEELQLILCDNAINNSKHSSSSSCKITRLLGNEKLVKHINCIDYEKLQLILCHDEFLLIDIIRLLGNQEVVKNIVSFSIEQFLFIFYSDNFKCIDTIELLENQGVVDRINSIAPEKLELIFDKLSPQDIIQTLKDQKIIDRINSIAPEELELIFNKLSSQDIIQTLKDQKIVDCINSIAPEKQKLIFDKFSSQDIIQTLKDQKIVDCINSIAPEKLELIFYKFILTNIIKVLKDQKIVDCINSIDTEKFRSLLDNKRLSSTIVALLENQYTIKYIHSVNNEELKATMSNIADEELVSIFKNFTPSIKLALRLAIALCRAGEVKDINIDYLNNKERICEDIIKYVPQELIIYTKYPFPGIGLDVKYLPQERGINMESLISLSTFTRCTECEEPVSTLYNLSLEQVIGSINPHKRARYS